MARDLNKVILIGRLTADPESRTFSNGGKVSKIRLAVNNSKKNAQTGQWEDDPMFIDVDAFNRGDFGTLANIVEQYCRKGSRVCVEGHLVLESWDDKTTGQKRSKHKIVAETIQLLESRAESEARQSRAGAAPAASSRSDMGGYSNSAPHDMHDEPQPASSGGQGEEIPF